MLSAVMLNHTNDEHFFKRNHFKVYKICLSFTASIVSPCKSKDTVIQLALATIPLIVLALKGEAAKLD